MLHRVAKEMTTAAEHRAPPPKRGRLRRTFGTILATLGLTTVFACSVVISLGLHVNLPPFRRIAHHAVNRALENVFEGQVLIEGLEQVKFDQVEIKSLVAVDPFGHQTIHVSGVKAQFDLRGLIREAMNGNTLIAIPLVQVSDVEVRINRSDDGRLGIERTFFPRPAKRPSKPSKTPKKPSKAWINLDRIEVDHIWAHGDVTAPRNLDADLNKLVASLHIDTEKFRLDVQPTKIRERGLLPAEIAGDGEYHLHIDFPPAAQTPGQTVPVIPRMSTAFTGRAGSVEIVAKAGLDGQNISASLELPNSEAADVIQIVPGVPIQERTALRATIGGEFPNFDVDATLDLIPKKGDPASIALAGKLDVHDGANIVLNVTTTRVNAQSFREDLPATTVDAWARMAFSTKPAPRFVVDASVEPTTLSGQSIPAIDAHAVYDHGLLEGRVTLHEPGAPTQAEFIIEEKDSVRFEAESVVASFETVPRLKKTPLSGGGRVRVRGSVHGKELDARVDGNVHSFAVRNSMSLESGRIEGRVRGPLDQLDLDAVVTGNHLRAGENSADRVTVRATGPVKSPSVRAHLEGGDVEDLKASARIDPETKSVRNVDVHLSRGGEELHGKVAEVRADKGVISARGVALDGPTVGSIGGSLVIANQDITGNLKGKNIDLARLSRMFGVAKKTRGMADVDISLARTSRGRKGHVNVQVKDATLVPTPGIEFPGTNASINATFQDDRASLEASLRIEDHAKPGEDPATACDGTIAEVRVSETDAILRGPLLAPSTWTKLSGRAQVEAKDTRLDCVAKRLPLALILTEVGGKLDAILAIDRPVGQRFVSVKKLDVRTRGLKIAGPQMFGEDKPRWESRSMDIAVTGSLDGASGATTANLTLSDQKVLGELGATMALDLTTLVDDPKRRLESLAKTQGTVTLNIPRRSVASLKSLPSVLHDKLPPFDGDFAVTATATGTIEDPTLGAHVSAWQFAHVNDFRQPTEWHLPVDVDLVANYKAKKAGLVTQVRRHGREVASVIGNANVDLKVLALGLEYTPDFDLQTTLTRLPLGRIPFFSARGVNAQVSGTFRLGQHGDLRTAKARFDIPGVRINDEPALERAALSLDIEPSTSDTGLSHGTFAVELAGKDGGHINVAAYAGVDWTEYAPKVDDNKPAGLSIQSHDFQLSSLQPLVNGVFSRIGGHLNGSLNVASTMYGDESQGYVESNMELTNGLVHIPQIGQELKNAHFSLRSHERGSLHFENIQAEGISGRIHGSAIAKMKGLSFESATANFSIDKGEELPITFEGVPLGHAYGKITLDAERKPREMHLMLKMPEMHLALPASSSRAVQSLDPHPDIAISHAIGPKKEIRQDDAMAWITTIELGRVQIEGQGIDVKLTSPKAALPRIELRQEARLSGDIVVTSGTFEVLGKKFDIERGLVRLREEDAGNPYVNITARWDAPDGNRVYVDYAGILKPINEQKIRFRSDPPLPQQAILAMILSGGSSGSTGTASEEGSASATDLAANVVGGEIASTQINAVLSQIAPLRGLSTRLGTSDSGRLRTTVMYELGDTVKAEASYEGLPSGSRLEGVPTESTDTSGINNRTEINVDWRFYKNWSLRGSFGFGGTNQQPSSGLDVLWQYRY